MYEVASAGCYVMRLLDPKATCPGYTSSKGDTFNTRVPMETKLGL